MAQLEIASDLFQPGRWTLRSANLAAVAAACDALVQSLGLDGEHLTVWGRHYDEQNERSEDAYANERQLLGPAAHVDIVALPREPRPNWVWIDRLHVVATGASPAAGTPLLGLYVGSNGRIVLAVHHPSVTPSVHAAFRSFPDANGAGWDAAPLVDQCRVVIEYDADAPGELHVRAPQAMAHAVNDTLMRLQQLVAPW